MRAAGRVLTFLGVSAAVLVPRAAAACSPSCAASFTSVAPPTGASVPLNAPAFAVQWEPSSPGASGPGPLEDGGVELVRSDGGVIRVKVEGDPRQGWYLVRPLNGGTQDGGGSWVGTPGERWTLRVRDVCSAAPAWTESTFSTGATVTVPWSGGSLQVMEAGTAGLVMSATGCGTCTKPIRAGYARFKLFPSYEVSQFAGVTRLTLLVDGVPWASQPYGRLSPDGGVLRLTGERSVLEVFSRCDSDPDGDPGIAPGFHDAALVVHVAGAAVDPPQIQDTFFLSCNGVDAVPRPPDPCLGGLPSDAGPQIWPDAGPDAGRPPFFDGGPPFNELPPEPRCGCGGGPVPLVALGLALAARARRREPAARA
ncbi:MAG TPA: hypothetical protein VND93_14735 [Myxococcales bacterium]|nr:hypothetical protein [Myxococcales bacterium]